MRLPLHLYRRRPDLRHLRNRIAALEAELAAQVAAITPLSDVEQMLQSVSDAVVVTDPELRIRQWNAAAEALFGWPAAEVLGRRTMWKAAEAEREQLIARERAARVALEASLAE
jgi:PAS domain-containing protein